MKTPVILDEDPHMYPYFVLIYLFISPVYPNTAHSETLGVRNLTYEFWRDTDSF
jgi:hypothetical protein